MNCQNNYLVTFKPLSSNDKFDINYNRLKLIINNKESELSDSTEIINYATTYWLRGSNMSINNATNELINIINKMLGDFIFYSFAFNENGEFSIYEKDLGIKILGEETTYDINNSDNYTE